MNSLTGFSGLKGTGYKSGQMSNFTPEQMNLFKSLFSSVSPSSSLYKLANGDQSEFEQLEAPALKQFSGLQGNLASRFSGMGSAGARRSSGFQNASNSAAQDFASQLQAQRMNIQNNARMQLHQMSQDLLNQRPYENFLVPEEKKSSFLEQLLGGLSGAAGGIAGNLGTFSLYKKLGLV